MIKVDKIKVSNEEIKEISKLNGEVPFWSMPMEEENVIDAKDWLKNDEMYALVSEIHGGIIGYIHKDHIDDVAGILNVRVLDIQ